MFLTQGLGGGGSTLKTQNSDSSGCWGFQVLMPVPKSRPVLNTHQALPSKSLEERRCYYHLGKKGGAGGGWRCTSEIDWKIL